jgi:hypothetical protein
MGLKDDLESLPSEALRRALEVTLETSAAKQIEAFNEAQGAVAKQLERYSRSMEEAQESRGERLGALMRTAMSPLSIAGYSTPALDYISKFRPVPPEERQAEVFMEGLQRQTRELEENLKENQELLMFCCHGFQRMQVLEISMPSHNVVSMRCVDGEGNETHVTGHMHSVTFSYMIHTLVPPQVRIPIGFNMPSSSEE